MSLSIGAPVWGVQDIDRSVAFWTRALDYVLRGEPQSDWASLVPRDGDGVQLSLMLVSSRAEDRRRHHLDLFTDDREAEVVRLLSLGAGSVEWEYEEDADYVVLSDPDGNLFCVVQR
ncbi:VOC family protein [Plantibacter sp. M259]|uniref:VOC family protein n=1 Tax=Plantibacter sp. M259 TaxID=2583822 RepID=UPI0011102CDE|nr:VOC family protein [Plantibacter sp. M259]